MNEENLALDAMRADIELDIETRQQYAALTEALEGDYMSGPDPREISDDWAETLDVGAAPTLSEAGQTFSANQVQDMAAHLRTLTSFVANIRRKDTDASTYDNAIDACYEMDVILRNPETLR